MRITYIEYQTPAPVPPTPSTVDTPIETRPGSSDSKPAPQGGAPGSGQK
ncbi:hypothetical protein HYV64_01625 [Candidatus Shapirobacteria bacterium]|nr:hypothetical protein [Candidatus Shapirobacteria bacterium]